MCQILSLLPELFQACLERLRSSEKSRGKTMVGEGPGPRACCSCCMEAISAFKAEKMHAASHRFCAA